MRALELSIADIAPTDIPVLLVGESGTGKEVIALEIHRLSERSNGIFVKCGCAGLTAESLIARLNSGERGTGDGETASGSLFLDEVGNLDLASQSRLLDMLADGPGMEAQNHVRMRIISSTTRSLEHEMRSGRFRQELYYRISGVSLHLPPLRERKQDISGLLELLPDGPVMEAQNHVRMRIISSTTRSLEHEMRSGRFRQELYYRISGVSLHLPPLRERKEDISGLLEFFLKKYASLFGWPEPQLGSATMDLLMRHSWPGNIRELENVARKIVALGNEQLAIADLQNGLSPKGTEFAQNPAFGNGQQSLKVASREASRRAEREMILKQLELTRWNRRRTARELQISYKALLYKLKQLGLDGPGNTDGQ